MIIANFLLLPFYLLNWSIRLSCRVVFFRYTASHIYAFTAVQRYSYCKFVEYDLKTSWSMRIEFEKTKEFCRIFFSASSGMFYAVLDNRINSSTISLCRVQVHFSFIPLRTASTENRLKETWVFGGGGEEETTKLSMAKQRSKNKKPFFFLCDIQCSRINGRFRRIQKHCMIYN